jgi:MFS family permease
MRTGIIEGVLAQFHLSVAFGTVITGLALLLGAGSFALGILGSMQVIGALVQIPAALWIERHGNRRRIAVIGTLGRLLWLIPPVLLFLPIAAPMKLTIFLLALASGHLLLGIASNAWMDWMTDLIPAGVRGRYFGLRSALMNGVAMVVGLGGASLIDWGKVRGAEAWAYAFLLSLGALGGGLASFLLTKQPEPPMEREAPHNWRDLLLCPLRDHHFRRFASTFVIWQIGLGLGAPFFIAYGLKALHLPLRTLALMDAVTALVGIMAQPQWGKLADRIGQAKVLRLCMLLVCPTPFLWLLAAQDRVWPLFLASTIGGIMWAGLATTQINRLMEHVPSEGRSAYLAAFSVATGLPFLFASLGAGALMSALGVDQVTLLGMTFHPYLAFFVASGVLRFTSTVLGWKSV